MTIALSATQLKKQQEVNNFLAYLDGIQSGKYDFRTEEVTMLSGFNTDGVAGLSNTEINTVKSRLINFSNNISTSFNAAGDKTADYDLDNNGNATNDVQTLGYIVNGRSQANTSVRIANPSEAQVPSVPYHFATKGGYKIDYDGHDTTLIHDAQGRNLARIQGDPHVQEQNSGGYWDFGDDSSFILPDGTKVRLNTEGGSGTFITTGIVVDDGSKTFYAGKVSVGGKNFDTQGGAAVDVSTLSAADAALFKDENLADKSNLDNAGVFVYSEAANTGKGGWAIKTAEGKFEDVKNESTYDYRVAGGNSFVGQTEGIVKVSHEARIAALDGANASRIQALKNNGASLALIDSSLLELEAGVTNRVDTFNQLLSSGRGLGNYQKLIDGAYSQATLDAYIASANNGSTNPYDNMLDGNVSKAVIEGLSTTANLSDSSKLTYSIIANIRKDLSVDALKTYTNLHKDVINGTNSLDSFIALNNSIGSANIDSTDVINYAAFATRHKNADKASYDTYTNLLTSNRSTAVLDGYEALINRNASAATKTAFATLVNTNASDKVLTAFNKLSSDSQVSSFMNIFNKTAATSTKEGWLEEFADYSSTGSNDKLTVLNDLINLNYANSKAFIANAANLSKALSVHNLSNATTVLPMLVTLNDAGVNDTVKAGLVDLAQKGSSQTKLNAYTVINARKQQNEINALKNYFDLNVNDSVLQAFVDLVSGVSNNNSARIGTTNTLIALKETIGARVYPASSTADSRFSQQADTEMVRTINTLVTTIINNSSSHLSEANVLEKVNQELQKFGQANISSKNQLIAMRTAASIVNNGLTNLDSTITAITRSVESEYNSVTSRNYTSPEDRIKHRLESRLESLRNRKTNYESTLGSIPAGSTERKDVRKKALYERRVATTLAQIASLEEQLKA